MANILVFEVFSIYFFLRCQRHLYFHRTFHRLVYNRRVHSNFGLGLP